MGMRTGNGDIDITITIYPNTPPEKGSRYERAISRQISMNNLESMTEMYRAGNSLAGAVDALIGAMLYTLVEREQAEAKAEEAASQEVQDGEQEVVA